jgi:protein-tyrosine phosphatase
MNQWRSPTAEAVFKNSNVHTARSAGTSGSARIKVSQALLDWADMVFVMEKRHKQILLEKFPLDKQIIVLDIPDDYQYMDPELIAMIRSSLLPHLGLMV